jgi:hypothetical protein
LVRNMPWQKASSNRWRFMATMFSRRAQCQPANATVR